MEQLRPEDFHEWQQNPVTQYYFSQITAKIIEKMKYVGGGGTYNEENVYQTAMQTAKEIGAIEALQEVLDIEFIKG